MCSYCVVSSSFKSAVHQQISNFHKLRFSRRPIPGQRPRLQVHRDLRGHQPPSGRASGGDFDADPHQGEGGRQAEEEEGLRTQQTIVHLHGGCQGIGGAQEDPQEGVSQVEIV